MNTRALGPDSDIPRDRWGRPLIALPGTDDSVELVPFARASNLGKALSDESALADWKARTAARGIATSPALAAALATTPEDDRRAVDGIVEQALARAGAGDAATLGTAVHAACEAVDLGRPLSGLPVEVRDAVERYARLIDAHRLEPLPAWAELFLADPHLRAAGSADRFYRLPDGRVTVGDLKTSKPGAERYAALGWSVQLAVYANATPYRHRGRWGNPHPDLDRSVGVVVHVPSTTGAPALVHDVDLTTGYRLAELAVTVREARKARPLTTRQGVPA